MGVPDCKSAQQKGAVSVAQRRRVRFLGDRCLAEGEGPCGPPVPGEETRSVGVECGSSDSTPVIRISQRGAGIYLAPFLRGLFKERDPPLVAVEGGSASCANLRFILWAACHSTWAGSDSRGYAARGGRRATALRRQRRFRESERITHAIDPDFSFFITLDSARKIECRGFPRRIRRGCTRAWAW